MRIFLDCSGQWTRDVNGTHDAIDRTRLKDQMYLWQVPRKQQQDTFNRIRVMEQVAARIFRKRAQQALEEAKRKARR